MVLLAVTLALVLAAAGVVVGRERTGPVSSRLRSRVVVTLKSGAGFDGVLWQAGRSAWVLRNAQALGAGSNGEPVPVDGEVIVLTADIEFAQRP